MRQHHSSTPAAAMAACLPLVMGAPTRAQIIGRSTNAWYLRTPAGRVLGLIGPEAVRLSCALVVPTWTPDLIDPALTELTVGEGSVVGPGVTIAVRRTLPSRVVPGEPNSLLVNAIDELIGTRDIGLAWSATELHACIAAGRADRLMGLGPGLTPSGDDVLAAYLVTAQAWGVTGPRQDRLRSTVLANLSRTTDLSSQLLLDAMSGHAAEPVRALLAAVAETTPPVGDTRLEGKIHSVLNIGHTSGFALAVGIQLAGRDFLAQQDVRAALTAQRAS